jgi:hypothetical protein
MKRGITLGWAFWQREWEFLLCFALAAYVSLAAADFLQRSKVRIVDCQRVPLQWC